MTADARTAGFFPGFALETSALANGEVRLRRGGSGPPLLLLHGNPQTHAMWHAVAPKLAARYSVICPDLRGYGGSWKPAASADHAAMSKKAMAAELVELMERLGHPRFQVVSHDRGARVAHRMALDFPDRIAKLAVLDIVPTIEHFERTDMSFALGYYHWFWFAQAHPFPENLISAAPDDWWRAHTSRESKTDGFWDPQALSDYLAAARDPGMVRGMCEDYRAAATIDLSHDRASRAAGEKIRCPLLVLWGDKGRIGGWYEALELWRKYCSGPVSGGGVPSGHYIAEEAPADLLRHLDAFLS